MHYEQSWMKTYASVCSFTFSKNGNRFSSGTGFKVGDKIITNSHVIQVPNDTEVNIRFVADDGYTTTASSNMTGSEMKNRLRDGDPESSWDYAIIDAPEFSSISGLQLADQNNQPNIGCGLVWLGYQFEQSNLSIHTGILSSKYLKLMVNYLQLDGSVNHGNSGGPLIDPTTNSVVGIITRKATGLTESFDKLISVLGENAAIINSWPQLMNINGVDPVKLIGMTQTQMQEVSREIRRSANVGIGYAYDIRKIREAINLLAI